MILFLDVLFILSERKCAPLLLCKQQGNTNNVKFMMVLIILAWEANGGFPFNHNDYVREKEKVGAFCFLRAVLTTKLLSMQNSEVRQNCPTCSFIRSLELIPLLYGHINSLVKVPRTGRHHTSARIKVKNKHPSGDSYYYCPLSLQPSYALDWFLGGLSSWNIGHMTFMQRLINVDARSWRWYVAGWFKHFFNKV